MKSSGGGMSLFRSAYILMLVEIYSATLAPWMPCCFIDSPIKPEALSSAITLVKKAVVFSNSGRDLGTPIA